MGTELTTPDSSQDRFGPAMARLNERQRRFVVCLLEQGTTNHKRAAMSAGYIGDAVTLAVTASRLYHDEKVQAAIHEESVRRLHGAKAMAVSKLVQLAEDTLDEKVRLKALGMILNRVGIHETSEHKVTTTHRLDGTELEARIGLLAKKLGMDPASLLGTEQKEVAKVDAIDVEVEELDRSGLEDII